MGIHKYFQSLSDLEGIYRCPGVFKYQEHSVASHSFKVATIAQFLATVEAAAGNTVDWKTMYERAINHDYSELFTGDIKTPVKYALPKLRQLLSQVEGTMIRQYLDAEFPVAFKSIYLKRFSAGKDDSLEGKILSVADKIDLLYEAFGEIQKGNPEPLFLQIYEEALASILKFNDLPSVQYFREIILKDMIKDVSFVHPQVQSITDQLLADVPKSDT